MWAFELRANDKRYHPFSLSGRWDVHVCLTAEQIFPQLFLVSITNFSRLLFLQSQSFETFCHQIQKSANISAFYVVLSTKYGFMRFTNDCNNNNNADNNNKQSICILELVLTCQFLQFECCFFPPIVQLFFSTPFLKFIRASSFIIATT